MSRFISALSAGVSNWPETVVASVVRAAVTMSVTYGQLLNQHQELTD